MTQKSYSEMIDEVIVAAGRDPAKANIFADAMMKYHNALTDVVAEHAFKIGEAAEIAGMNTIRTPRPVYLRALVAALLKVARNLIERTLIDKITPDEIDAELADMVADEIEMMKRQRCLKSELTAKMMGVKP